VPVPTTGWSIGRLTRSYYPRKLSFIHSHVPLASGR